MLRFNFREAMEFLFPSIADEIDWSQPIEFLDKEFQQLTPDSEIGKRFADQLVRVYKKGGGSIILLIHLEVQAEPETIFPERMFTYVIRIFDYFHQAPISLAILCDSDPNWRPSQFGLFIDWLMILSGDAKLTFWQELRTFEEERQMPYITSVEQIGYDRGIEEGGAIRTRSLTSLLLRQKVGVIPDHMIDRINTLSPQQLETLAVALLSFVSIDDLNTWIDGQA